MAFDAFAVIAMIAAGLFVSLMPETVPPERRRRRGPSYARTNLDGGRWPSNSELTYWLTTSLFALTYIALAFGECRGFVSTGPASHWLATLMLVTGALSFAQAVGPDCIDYKTLGALVRDDGSGRFPAALGPA